MSDASPGGAPPGDASPGDPRPRDVLRLGALTGAAPDRWVSRWHDRHPEIRVQVGCFDEAGQLERIRAGAVDIGYLRVVADDDIVVDTEIFHRVWLYREDAVVCAARDHWIAAAEESVTGEDVAEEVFLESAEVAAYDQRSADGVGESGELARAERLTLEVVASGAGVLVLPRSTARALSRKDVIIRRLEDHPGYDVGLGWLRERDDPVIQEFIGVTRGRRPDSARSDLAAGPGGDPRAGRRTRETKAPERRTPRTKSGGRSRTGSSRRPRRRR